MLIEKIESIQKEINSKATLVVAVKYANNEQMRKIVNSGVDIGFNTLQQFEQVGKKIKLGNNRVHFIGHIQSKKIKKIVESKPFLIQSVSSPEIAEKINLVCFELGVVQKILLQINSDPNKIDGFNIDELGDFVVRIMGLSNLEVCGLMAIPTPIERVGGAGLAEIYKKIKLEYDKLKKYFGPSFKFLSMGMSKDYLIAIDNGANMVRIGRKIFT